MQKNTKETDSKRITKRAASGKGATKSTVSRKSTSNTKVSKSNSAKKTLENKSTKNNNSKAKQKSATKVNSKKSMTKKSRNTSKEITNSKRNKKPEIIEYYDLPYRYNQTVVKILAHEGDKREKRIVLTESGQVYAHRMIAPLRKAEKSP